MGLRELHSTKRGKKADYREYNHEMFATGININDWNIILKFK